MSLQQQSTDSFGNWIKRGDPFVWLCASAVTVSVLAVIGLLLLLAVRGFGHFWPADVFQAQYQLPGQAPKMILAERVESESVPLAQLQSAGVPLDTDDAFIRRELVKVGNRDIGGADFTWVISRYLQDTQYPSQAVAMERREWGNFYGYLLAVKESGSAVVPEGDEASRWQALQQRLERARQLRDQIDAIEKDDIGAINYSMERLRLADRSLELKQDISDLERQSQKAEIEAQRRALQSEYQGFQAQLADFYRQLGRDSVTMRTADGTQKDIALADVVRAYRPNGMGTGQKLAFYFSKFAEFLSDDPREANTEGGIFPAIFGTVIMVLIMSVMVTPFGVMAAVYLREYAHQGAMTRIIRIAVNNLAGVPSIVYGVFGLGFFIYFLGSEIDQFFYREALPAPTFGTPGLLWASVTLALLTLPVVIVATEEGLSRIPRNVREGSLALGATKAETLWRVVLPMTSPAMMTGLILAVARAAGEVAPLMLVGVVKLAPSLPVDGHFPYFHLERKFMHLGFHIYDVGFQSPNVEAARPLVYATALLLVVIIALLNFSAVAFRNHLREKYKSLDI